MKLILILLTSIVIKIKFCSKFCVLVRIDHTLVILLS